MMKGKIDPHSAALQELLEHLRKKDGDDLRSAMQPEEVDVAVVEGAEPGAEPGNADEGVLAAEAAEPGADPSGQDLEDLIEALQSTLGA